MKATLILMGVISLCLTQTIEAQDTSDLRKEKKAQMRLKGQDALKSVGPLDPGITSEKGEEIVGGGEGNLLLITGDNELRLDGADIQRYDLDDDDCTGILYLNDLGGPVSIGMEGNLFVYDTGIGINENTEIFADLDVSGTLESGHIGIGTAPIPNSPLKVVTDQAELAKFSSTATNASMVFSLNGSRKGAIHRIGNNLSLVSDDGLVQLMTNIDEPYVTVNETGTVTLGGTGTYVAPGSNYSTEIRQNSTFGLNLFRESNSNHWEFSVNPSTTDANLNMYYNGGFRGSFSAVDGLYTASDRSLKRNIRKIGGVLPSIMALEVNRYQYKTSNKECVGFIAQDLKEYFPEFVDVSEDERSMGLYSVNYANLSTVAIKAIQEQQTTIESQTLIIDQLAQEIKVINEKFEELEKTVAQQK